MDIWEFIKATPDILIATLAILGGLKVIARYTKWTWDDKALEVAEAVVSKLAFFLPKKPQ